MAEAVAPRHPLPHGSETHEICLSFPSMVNSYGIWESLASPSDIFQVFFTSFRDTDALDIRSHTSHLCHPQASWNHFLCLTNAGIILGPTIMKKAGGFTAKVYTQEVGIKMLDNVAIFGFGMFLFLMGVKMDVKMAFRTTRRATVIGFASVLCPFLVGLIVYEAYKKPDETIVLKVERFLGITVESLTAFSVVACLLSELKIVNSELGRLALSSAAICDLCNLVIMFLITFAKNWILLPSMAVKQAGLMVLFIVVLFCVFRPLMFWMIKQTPEGRPINEVHITIILMLALGCGVFTHWYNESPLFGVFLFGFAVPDGPPIGSALVDKFECFANGFFLVVFVTTSTMRVDPMKVFTHEAAVGFSIIFPILAFITKFITCFVASFWNTTTWRDSLAFALIMSSKGVISEKTFSKFSILILVNATIIPILVKHLYDPVSRKHAVHQKRSMVHLKPNAELRILACIHTPEHVQPLIDVLDITCPTKQSPNFVYALHLIQLAGRDSPVFIAHHKNGAVGSFEHIVAFNHYEQNNWGLVKVNAFTAISPPKLMHEDICNLVLDNQISFLLLPFHRKWCIEGSVEAENSVIRNLNRNVLDRAPCSIGILVDRGRKLSLSRSSFYSIGMLFIGGKDDREALTLAKRMARDPTVKLTVIHLLSEKDRGNVDWDMMLDTEILKGVKQNEVSNIMYIGEVSNNGPQTATIVRSVMDDFDLMIVGRHYGVDSVQTKGLTEWSEFPELGIMGDILSSPDLVSRVSVLIVQQHHVVVGKH
ncbi:cation/H(+) antiporter 4-like [Hibiscus syriacus]|uniref:cation/H(+) antiporter 4-like n=1 Tax=Hibiscus syriacus TaxID=106335 RepID=UPI0019216B5F|nr:cation/H(+) antiporter 4-like [Hibiscus syriacus]